MRSPRMRTLMTGTVIAASDAVDEAKV